MCERDASFFQILLSISEQLLYAIQYISGDIFVSGNWRHVAHSFFYSYLCLKYEGNLLHWDATTCMDSDSVLALAQTYC